ALTNANGGVGNVSIDGQTGDDPGPLNSITLGKSGTTRNLTLAADNILINLGATVDTTAASGTNGQVSFTPARSIFLNRGAGSIKEAAGAIRLRANQQGTPTSGPFVGIEVNHTTITSATGAILLQGKGGDTGSSNHGIVLEGGTVVSSTGMGAGAATITLVASSGAGTCDYLGL